MSSFVFFSVLAAAFLHAAWNALIKHGSNKFASLLVMALFEGLIALAIIVTKPWPAADVWPWLLASGVIHTIYMYALANAYEHGDLSRVYPISRGAAPMIVLALGALLLADRLTLPETLGIIVLGFGIMTMAHGVFSQGESRSLLPFALLTASATAAYTLVDGQGARIAGDAMIFVAWMFFIEAVMFSTLAIALGRASLPQMDARGWLSGALAAAASYGAYLIAVWAMTKAPIALVSALRETSILFAVLIGWLLFGDRMHRGKAIAALLIVAGVILTRL